MEQVRSDYYVYVYKYTDGTPFYVGKGVGDRHIKHLQNVRLGYKGCNQLKQNVIKKMLREGKEPIIEKIVENIDNELACLVEQEYISKYGRRTEGGLLTNMTDGGDEGFKIDPISIEKMRQTKIGNKYCVGIKHTDEAKKNMSLAHKGSPKPWLKGKKRTAETVKKISLAKIGKPSKKKGIKLSEEQKEFQRQVSLRDKWTCNVCGTTGLNKGAGNRWHFTNCKKVL
jgi:hypothetical protein